MVVVESRMRTVRMPLSEDAACTGGWRARYHVGNHIVLFFGATPYKPDPEREWAGALVVGDSYSEEATKALRHSMILDDIACFSNGIFSSRELWFVLCERHLDDALNRIAEWKAPVA